MAAIDDGRRAARDTAVRRLVESGRAGPLSRAQVARVAREFGVSERTVARWVTQARGQGGPPAATESASLDSPALPDPAGAATIDGLVDRLRLLKAWAGNPSYETVKKQVNNAWTAAGRPAAELAGKTTVVDCFRLGRRRMSTELVVAIVQALHPDAGYVRQWRQALQVIGARSTAAAQVRVQDKLPPELAGFTGRAAELRRILDETRDGAGAVVISAIAGMAGVGKTQLAIRAGHLLLRERQFDRVLFVNLRGFHPDPAHPPADPAAVLDGFLRLLDMPGNQIPYGLEARASAYRRLLAGTRTLVILDNAADADQVRPLLPGNPGCPVLVTSRRTLTDLHGAAQLPVGVFTVDDALRYLKEAAPGVPVGDDPDAAARIARRCGYLPLALGLVTGHMRARPGWTRTDHADWLDQRHRNRRLVTGVELALDLSYRHLPADRRRLLRLTASHPGQDFDKYAAAALADTDPDTAEAHLDDLCGDHLLQRGNPGRYSFHDLVHAYAVNRAEDEDRTSVRRAALTRLLDHYLRSATAAGGVLEPDRGISGTVAGPADRDAALAWFTAEHAALLAIVDHAAASGRDPQTIELAQSLFDFLDRRGHWHDLVRVQHAALEAAHRLGDLAMESRAHRNLAAASIRLGQFDQARGHLQDAIDLAARSGDVVAQAKAHYNLAYLWDQQRDYRAALRENERAMALYQAAGHRQGQARALGAGGWYQAQFGEYRNARATCRQAIALFEEIDDRLGLASTLDTLGLAHLHLGEHTEALTCYRRSVEISRAVGSRYYEGIALTHLGDTYLALGDRDAVREAWSAALTILESLNHLDAEDVRRRLTDLDGTVA